jgi:uncharacterized protein with PQ loop repeat
MDITTIIGVSGAAIILVFFLLNQAYKIKNDSLLYDGANFIGGLLLVIYAFLLSSLPFMILNAVWALFSLRDLFREIQRKYNTTPK